MSGESGPDRLCQLIQAIQKHAEFDHPVGAFELVETHISYVLLTGHFAYKFKKPLDLGFLDFTTLEKRKFYCEEEIRLNRRFAPQIYLNVVTITGPEDRPALGGDGEAIEYAVKMVQFPKGAELDKVLECSRLTPSHIDELALQIADFHEAADAATPESPFGTVAAVRRPVVDNFTAIRPSLGEDRDKALLDQLERWTRETLENSAAYFTARKNDGYIRECHGDLHLGNIALYRDRPVLFDCIEFSREFRWIDVMNEIAFLVMDLDARGKMVLARRFLNHYLEVTGDYEGLHLLPFYCVYRALVRCKIACIRLAQDDLTAAERKQTDGNSRHYLELAGRYIQPLTPALVITHGFSGSGKTTLTQPLLEDTGAIRIRSDVERKRLQGLAAGTRTGSALAAGIYSREITEKTYERLLSLAGTIVAAGYPVIVDATFLKREQRSRFECLAKDLDLPFLILDFQAQPESLRNRLLQREKAGGDASEADLKVLEYQLDNHEPLDEAEHATTLVIGTSVAKQDINLDGVAGEISRLTGGHSGQSP